MKKLFTFFTMLFILISSIAFSQQAKEFNLPPRAKFMPKLYQEIDYSYKLNDLSLNEAVTKNFLNKFTETDLDKLKMKDNATYNYYKVAQNYFISLSDTVKKKFTVEELWHVYIYDQKLKNKLKIINDQ